MKSFFLLYFLIAFSGPAAAQSATAETDRQQILIGEPVKLRLSAGFVQGTPLDWPAIDSLPHFEIMERSKIDTQQQGNYTMLSQTLTLTSWDSGRWKIPALALGAARTSPVGIDVSFTKMDPDKPYHDVKDILLVQEPSGSKWYWYVIFAVILALLFRLFFPKAKKKNPAIFVADESAYAAAIKQLTKLEAQTGSDPKWLHTEWVQVLRTYLHRRRNIQSFSQTTDDLAVQISRLGLPAAMYQSLVEALQLSDMVKFARYQPQPAENESALSTARQSIEAIETLPHAV